MAVEGEGDNMVLDGSNIGMLADAFARIFNLVLLGSGAVAIIMILWSSYKYSMAFGDAKALEGAKQSLTYSIFGFVIVLGFFFIVSFTANYFGLAKGTLLSPASVMKSNLNKLQNIVNQSDGNFYVPCANKGFCVIGK